MDIFVGHENYCLLHVFIEKKKIFNLFKRPSVVKFCISHFIFCCLLRVQEERIKFWFCCSVYQITVPQYVHLKIVTGGMGNKLRAGLLFRETLESQRKSWRPKKANATSCSGNGITLCSSVEVRTDGAGKSFAGKVLAAEVDSKLCMSWPRPTAQLLAIIWLAGPGGTSVLIITSV